MVLAVSLWIGVRIIMGLARSRLLNLIKADREVQDAGSPA